MPRLPWRRRQLSRAGQATLSDATGAVAATAGVVRVEKEKGSSTGAAAAWAAGVQSDKRFFTVLVRLRTPCLSHAKRALYDMSYTPFAGLDRSVLS